MDNAKLISKIFFEIQKDPSDYRAYEDVFSLCRSIEESDFKLAHDTNAELRSYISRGMKTSAYAKLFDLYRRSLLFDAPYKFDSYVYMHEIERKCARFAESILASDNRAREVETALRYWSNMVTQYAIDITDKAVEQAYLDNDVEKVVWVTIKDERRCVECRKRDGKIYDIAKVPPKPHLGCRCYLLPYWGGTD